MATVKVKLVHPSNRVKVDDGKVLTGYETFDVELTDKVKDCIAQNLLEKVAASDQEQAKPPSKRSQASAAPEDLK